MIDYSAPNVLHHHYLVEQDDILVVKSIMSLGFKTTK